MTADAAAIPSAEEAAQLRREAALRVVPRVFVALLVVLTISALVAGGLLVLTVLKLSAKEQELASNSAVSLSAVTDIQADESALANLGDSDCGTARNIQTALTALTSDERQSLNGIDGVLNSIQLLCARSGSRGRQLADFYAAYVPAVIARQNSQYDQAVTAYKTALTVADDDQDLQARALEGSAYSHMKQGDLKAAQSAMDQAAPLKADYVFTQITQIKLACAERKPASDVKAMYGAAMTNRDKIVQQSAQDAAREKIATGDRALLANDAELNSMCGYAGIRP
jgi:tetratricopeptide (TPR) repeat protein